MKSKRKKHKGRYRKLLKRTGTTAVGLGIAGGLAEHIPVHA